MMVRPERGHGHRLVWYPDDVDMWGWLIDMGRLDIDHIEAIKAIFDAVFDADEKEYQ